MFMIHKKRKGEKKLKIGIKLKQLMEEQGNEMANTPK